MEQHWTCPGCRAAQELGLELGAGEEQHGRHTRFDARSAALGAEAGQALGAALGKALGQQRLETLD
jgi:hypothetical protein